MGAASKLRLLPRRSGELRPEDVQVARDYIREFWTHLERFHPKDDESLLGLPKPYLVPSYDEHAAFDYDVLVRRAEVERFEEQHGLFNGARSASAGDDSRPAARRGGPGVPPRYDWDGFYGALARRIHDHGIPPTQAELVREMLDWFGQRDGGEAPDESTVRRKIVAIWRELSRAHG